MAYQPTLADVEQINQQLTGQKRTRGYQPTIADIPTTDISTIKRPLRSGEEVGEKSFVDNLKNALLGIVHIPSTIYHTGMGAEEEFQEDPLKAARDTTEGALAFGENRLGPIFKEGIKTGATAAGLPISSEVFKMLDRVKVPTYHPEDPQADATKLGELAASLAPIAKVGAGVEDVARGAAGLLPEFFGKRLATGVTAGAGAGAAVSPLAGVSPGIGALTGGVLPAGLQPVGSALRRGISGTVSPEEFATARGLIPAGIKAPIGEIAASPSMQRLYGLSSGMFGSGAARPYEQLNAFLKNKQKEISGQSTVPIQDANQHLYDAMKATYDSAKERTNQAYNTLADESGRLNVDFNKKPLDNVLKNQIKEVKGKIINRSSAKLYGPTLDVLEDYKETVIPNFQTATQQLPVLNDQIENAVATNDRPLMRQLMKVKTGFEKSIKESADTNPTLQKLYDAAKQSRIHQGKFEKLNKRDLSPFYKVYLKNGDTGNFINQYLKPSKGTRDYSELLKHLTDRIPNESKKVLGSAYLESDTVPKFLKKLEVLNPRQREILFDEKAPDAEHLVNITKTFPEGASAAFEPKTGFKGAKSIEASGAAVGSLMALAHGSPEAAAIAALGIPVLGQALQRGLRSELLKNAYQRALESGTIAPDTTLMNVLRGIAMQGGQ